MLKKSPARYVPSYDLTVTAAIRALLRPPKTTDDIYVSTYLVANLQRLKRFRNHPQTTRPKFAALLYAEVARHASSPEKAKVVTVNFLRWVYPSSTKKESDRFYPMSYKELRIGRVQTLIARGGVRVPNETNLEAIEHRRPKQLSMDNSLGELDLDL